MTKYTKSVKYIIASAVLLMCVALCLGGCSAGNDTESNELIGNVKLTCYNVGNEEQGGFFGVTFTFDLAKNADGYEFMSIWDGETGDVQTMSEKSYPLDNTCFFFGTQQGPKELKVRAYTDQNGERQYCDWQTVIDSKAQSSSYIGFDEWESVTDGYIELDLYDL